MHRYISRMTRHHPAGGSHQVVPHGSSELNIKPVCEPLALYNVAQHLVSYHPGSRFYHLHLLWFVVVGSHLHNTLHCIPPGRIEGRLIVPTDMHRHDVSCSHVCYPSRVDDPTLHWLSGSSLSQRFSHKKEQPLASVAPARVQTHYVIYLWNVAELVLLLFALEPFISPLLALVSVPSHGQVVALVGRLLTPPSVFILRCACCNPGRR